MQLKTYRKKLKISQQACADGIGITVQYYGDIERGKKTPGLKVGAKILKWAERKVTPKDLWPHLKF